MKPRHEYDEALGAKGVAPVPFAGPLVLFRRLWRMASEQFRNATSAVVRLLIFGEAALFSIGDAHFAQGESERGRGSKCWAADLPPSSHPRSGALPI